MSTDPGLLKIRHSHRFVAVVTQILILFMRNGFKFLTQVESKTNQFEIVFKSLARFSTLFRIKESFKPLFAI